MHLRCPHCQNPIELVDVPSGGAITCAGCGSSFQLDRFSTAIWEGPEKKRIGKFEVLATVGHGAFGTVVKARDIELDRIVAIKIPRAGNVGARPEDVDRFLREARSVAQLRFPSIITIHEVGADNGTPYLVCDFVEGITLADHLTGRRFSFTESAKLLAEVADALQYAHSLGVVHRDVKPSNIMVRPEGSPCVMDFGLAKRDAGEITMTIDGQILGTPAYMSPEQARGEGHQVDGRSDVYSLGVILYQLLTGELPFRGNKAMLLHQVLHDEPRGPRTLNDKIPRDLETIALKAMAKEPARRYASAKEMGEDLRRWLAGEPILARPVGTLERAWRWCKREPALATANAVVVIALVAVSSLLFLVKQSLDQEEIERGKAVTLASEKQKLADNNKKLADESDERRERAEHLAVQAQFDGAYTRYLEHPAAAMAASVPLLASAARLADRMPEQTLRTYLAAWHDQTSRHVFVHDNGVQIAMFSPDGKSALTVSWDGTARLWDSAAGKPLGPPLHFFLRNGRIAGATIRPDGQSFVLVTSDSDNTARLWDSAAGKPIGVPLDQGSVVFAAFSADCKRVVTTSFTDKIARIWDCATCKPLGPPLQHEGAVVAAAFSPDGKSVVTASHDKTAQLWDCATCKPLGPPLQHQQLVVAAAFSRDGQSVVTAGHDKTARLWDSATGKPLCPPLRGHDQAVVAAAFSPDGKSIVTAGSIDHTARLWNAATGKPLGPPLVHQGHVRVASFSPDGKSVLTADDKTARLWDSATGKPLCPPLLHQDNVVAASFSPDGSSVLTASADGTARLWDAVGRPLRHQSAVTAAAFSPDGKSVLTASADKTARLWDSASAKPLGPLMQQDGPIYTAAFSPDGKSIVTAGFDKTARLWDSATGVPLCPPLHHQNWVMAAVFSPDGKSVVTASHDKTARLWDSTTGKPLCPPLHHQDLVRAAVFSPDGKRVITSSFNNPARLWDSTTGKPLDPPLPHKNVMAAAFSPDGRSIVTGSNDNTARVWDSSTGKPLGPPLRHQGGVWPAAFSPDGKTIVTASFDKTARMWDIATGKPLGPPLLHQDSVRAVAFSPDGRVVVTASYDGTARMWDSSTGKPFGAPMQHRDMLDVAAFSPDGKSVVTASHDCTARLWTVPRPVQGTPEHIVLWCEARTGLTLDKHGEIRVLGAAAWHERRQRLQELGGPPVID